MIYYIYEGICDIFLLICRERKRFMGELSKLPNIGKIVEEQLIRVGIDSADELKKIGAKAAWLKIQEIDESACINRLMALEGAVEGVKKNMLSDEVKTDLKEFYWKNKKQNEFFNNCKKGGNKNVR